MLISDFTQFVETMDLLGAKLGPLVLQVPYFNRTKFKSGGEFIKRLKSFMERFPKDHRFAVEIRNRNWLDARFADALRERNVALVLQDQSWMPRPTELFEKFVPITADFTFIRWLGDRKGIEESTKLVLRTGNDTPYLYGNLADDWLNRRLAKLGLHEVGMGWHSLKRSAILG